MSVRDMVPFCSPLQPLLRARMVVIYFRDPPEFLLRRIVMSLQKDLEETGPEFFVLLSEPQLDDQLPDSINRAYLDLAAHAEDLYRRKELDPFRSLLVIAGAAALERRTELLKEDKVYEPATPKKAPLPSDSPTFPDDIAERSRELRERVKRVGMKPKHTGWRLSCGRSSLQLGGRT